MTDKTTSEPVAGFTPGPWGHLHRACADGMWRTQVFPFADPMDAIATLQWTSVEVEQGHIVTNREANARLISSAPDLLEALKAVDAQVFCDCPERNGVVGHQPGCFVPIARAAISKATRGAE